MLCTSENNTSTFFCEAKIERIGNAISDGESAQVATWYRSG